ncbi:MAG: TauD/TfdA family dioxygenase [Limnohabitans sp.]|nr:TauD/TfdA family dioxygenase [Limnohabitans sp.]
MAMQYQLNDGPLGAYVRGVDINHLTPDGFNFICQLLHDRGVITIKTDGMSEVQQIDFAKRFGELQKNFLDDSLDNRFPELLIVSNILENDKPIGSTDAGRFWHTDGAYLSTPHSVSMLYAVEVPFANGKALGDTSFISMGAAYEALSHETQQQIESLRGVHSLHFRYATKSGSVIGTEELKKKFPPVSHPLAISHPVTGRRCLYVSEGYTTSIEGVDDIQGQRILDQLLNHIKQPAFCFRHSWSVGDLLIWDNLATLHLANFDYALPLRRLMRRATVSGQSLG